MLKNKQTISDSSASQSAQLVLFFTVLLNSTGFGIIIPVMPALLIEISGEPLANAVVYQGWLMFSYALIQFFFAPMIGNLSDRFGRRPVILAALAVFSLDFFIMAWAPSLAWLFAGRMLAGLAASTQSAANAYIADISSPEDRAGRYGLLGAAFGIGFLIGPVIGGLLGEFGSRVPFIGGGVLGLFNLIGAWFLLKESLSVEKRRVFEWTKANPFSAFFSITQYPMMTGLLVTLFLYVLGHFVFPATWAYYTMEKFSWTPADIGYSLGVVGLSMIIVQGLLTRRVVKLFGTVPVLILGLIISCASYLGYGLLSEGWMMYLVMIPGALSGFTIPAMQQLMTGLVQENRQGQLQGLISSVYSLTAIIGPLMMTWLFARFTEDLSEIYFPGAPFVLAAFLAISSLVILAGSLIANRSYFRTDKFLC